MACPSCLPSSLMLARRYAELSFRACVLQNYDGASHVSYVVASDQVRVEHDG